MRVLALDFDLSAEQKMLQESLSDLFADAVDANSLVRLDSAELRALGAKLDGSLYEMGLAGILVPEQDGGLDMGLLTLAVIAEQLGRNAAPTSLLRNALAAWVITQAGSDAQKEKWLSRLLSGQIHAAFAIEDADWLPDRGSVPAGESGLRKRNVEGGELAGLFVVGLAGGQLGLADPGAVRIEPRENLLDVTRPIADLSITPEQVEPLADSNALLDRLRDAHLILLAADAYGAGQRTLDISTEYAMTRRQFDQVIGAFQGLKHQLANMAAEIYPSRFLVWYAAHAWDEGFADSSYSSALAKAHVPDVAVRTARGSVEAHGGIGYTWEYPLHIFLKRAMYDREVWAGVETHRSRVAVAAGW